MANRGARVEDAIARPSGDHPRRINDDGAHWKLVLGGLVVEGVPGIDNYPGPMAAPSATAAWFLGSWPGCGTASVVTTGDGAVV